MDKKKTSLFSRLLLYVDFLGLVIIIIIQEFLTIDDCN